MAHGYRRRKPLVRGVFAWLLVTLLLIACGGSSDADDAPDPDIVNRFPLVAGARMLDVSTADEDDLNVNEIDVSNVGAGIYTSTLRFDVVVDYYTNRIQSEGWTVATSYPVGGARLYFLNHGADVAIVTLAEGDLVKETPNLISNGALEFDPSDIQDSDTLIVVSHFTCEEESLAACQIGLGR